jgi:hypothetical protein
MTDLLWLIGIGLLVWFWVDTLNARERAVALCREACRVRGLQLLDQTVALDRIVPARDRNGRVRWRRRYRFEFTSDGAIRDSGTVVMLGVTMEALELKRDGGRDYEQGEF